MCVDAPVVPGTVRFLGKSRYWSAQGFVAEIPGEVAGEVTGARTRCIIAFRGSVDVMNYVADLEVWQTAWPNWGVDNRSWCPDCQVHQGVAFTYRELRPSMLSAIRSLNCSSFAMAGHSLGGSMAALASLDIRRMGWHVHPVYTFGKLRNGNQAFVEAYVAAARQQGTSPPMWRVVASHDVVPRLPMDWLGYVHEPLEVYYSTEARVGSFRVCSSTPHEIENPVCAHARSVFSCLWSDDHNMYLDKTTKSADMPVSCDAEGPSFTAASVWYVLALVCIAQGCCSPFCLLCCYGKRCGKQCAKFSAGCYYGKYLPWRFRRYREVSSDKLPTPQTMGHQQEELEDFEDGL